MGFADGNPRGTHVFATCLCLLLLACFFVISRLLTRTILVKNLGTDDVLVTLALVAAVAYTTSVGFEVQHGLGRHLDTLLPSDVVAFQKAFYASVVGYNLTQALTKLSVLLQYHRIFVHHRFQKICKLFIWINALYGTCWVTICLLSCNPVHYFWDKSGQGKCLDSLQLYHSNAGVNIALDIVTILLPLPVLSSLNLPLRQRFALMGLFCIGALTCIISIYRLVVFIKADGADWSYQNDQPALWSGIEICLAIICACSPALKPALARLLPSIFGNGRNDGTMPRCRHWGAKYSATNLTADAKQDQRSVMGPWDVEFITSFGLDESPNNTVTDAQDRKRVWPSSVTTIETVRNGRRDTGSPMPDVDSFKMTRSIEVTHF